MVSHFSRVACLAAVMLILSAFASTAAHSPDNTAQAAAKPTDSKSDLAGSPLEARLLADAADGRWDDHTLFTAAQIASGVTAEAELLAARLDFARLVRDLQAKLSSSNSAEDRAAEVLAFLHQELLWGGYDLDATALPQACASGRFNCVSATVLFNCLAAEVELPVGVLRLPQHTCSALLDDQRCMRIEATSPDWFAMRQRLSGIRSPGGSAGLNLDGVEKVELISDVALVGMIYYNRGVEAVRHKDFDRAIALNRLALALDGANADARANLLAAINKQALELAAREQFAAAALLIEQGLEIDPDHAPLRQNQMWIDKKAHEVGRTAGN